jgi:hypothetical protein
VKRLSIEVRGHRHLWSFTFMGDPQYLDDWRGDGLIVAEVVNDVPCWIVNLGLLRPYVFLQNVWNMRMGQK